jgi:hypothetical protein
MAEQSAQHLLMIEPAAFQCNPQTLLTNHFQHHATEEVEAKRIHHQAVLESRALRDALVEHGVCITTFKGLPQCPDDIFPNNWVSTEEGTYNLYPMLVENRRLERRADIIQWLEKSYRLKHDYSAYEAQGLILESTGSLIRDNVHRKVFVCRSARADEALVQQWCKDNGYTPVVFDALDGEGFPIYHTNVMMYIGTGYVGVCLEAIPHDQRDAVVQQMQQHHEVIELSLAQISRFCGNALEVRNTQGQRFLVMSQQACDALDTEQRQRILAHVNGIISSPLETIEYYGGGSARCMLLELY